LFLLFLFCRLGTVPTTEDTLLDAGIWSHFVSLTFPSIDVALPSLPALRIGADAFELRVDLLSDISTSSLHRQIALLRKSCPLPIVFTVRSVGQIGKFPDETPKKMFDLLREGLRAGCEWIDVEACWGDDYINSLTSLAQEEYACTSRLLGSLHITTPQSENQIASLFEKTKLKNAAHMLKVQKISKAYLHLYNIMLQ
jgi:3-dehydroquinate dehydratase type I